VGIIWAAPPAWSSFLMDIEGALLHPAAPRGNAWFPLQFKFSVSMPGHAHLLEIEGLFTQGWPPGRTPRESVGGILKVDSSGWVERG